MVWKFELTDHKAPMFHSFSFEFEAEDYEQAKDILMMLFGVSPKWYVQYNIGSFVDNKYSFVHQNMVMFFTLSVVEEKVVA